MSVALPTSRLQGCLYNAAAFTIRLTYDPTGAATVSDFTVAAEAFYASHDAFLAAWEAEVEADLGTAWTFTVAGIGGGLGFSEITSPGLNLSINWSFAGDGTTVRNWLGWNANVTNQPSPLLSDTRQPAAFYPVRPFQATARGRTARPRAHGLALDGSSQTQHDTSPSDGDEVDLDLVVFFGETAAHTNQRWFEEVFLDGLHTYSDGLQFTAAHGTESWFLTFRGTTLRLETTPVHGHWDNLWQVTLPVTVVRAA